MNSGTGLLIGILILGSRNLFVAVDGMDYRSRTRSCPFQTTQMQGYSDGDTCLTILQLFPGDLDIPGADIQMAANLLCAKNFKKGMLHSFLNPSAIRTLHNVNKSLLFSGVTFISKKYLDYFCWSFFCTEKVHLHEYEVEMMHQNKKSLEKYKRLRLTSDAKAVVDYKSGHTSQEIRHLSGADWNKEFEGDYPKCLIHDILGDGSVVAFDLKMCHYLKDRKNIAIPCLHSHYKNCVYEVIKKCVGEMENGKLIWHDNYMYIHHMDEKPFGTPCPERKRGNPCKPMCTGKQYDWSKPPNANCSFGGRFFRKRYRAQGQYSESCDKNSSLCCEEVEEVKMPDCYHFDKTMTVLITNTSCQNDGQMAIDKEGYRKCICLPQFEGITCEIDKCSDRCLNGATCVATIGTANVTCMCSGGFTGEDCGETLTTCGESAECKNGGTCMTKMVNNSKSSYCKCPPKYGGSQCELVSQRCESMSCNKHGKCIENMVTRRIMCHCDSGYSPPTCKESNFQAQLEAALAGSKGATFYIVLIFVCIGLGTFCVGGTTIVHRRRRRRRHRHGKSGSSRDSNYSSSVRESVWSRISRMGKTSTMASTKQSGMNSKYQSKTNSTFKR